MRLSGAGRWLLPLLLALCLIRLWLMPLPSSFWLDETATIFVAQFGAHHPSLADAAPQAWRSWYYPVIGFEGSLFGFSEVAVRLLSVLAMAGVLMLVAWLARRLIAPEAGWFAVFACLALPGFNYQAANARPYALGMCLFASALLLLIRWLDTGRWVPAAGFVVCAALTLYIHLLFWPSSVVFGLYAGARLVRKQTPVPWGRAVLLFALLACSLLPVLAATFSLLRDARAHVIAPLPSIGQFVKSLEWPLPAACVGGAWIAARVRGWRSAKMAFAPSALALIAAWWLCQPVLLFAFSWITGDAVFVPRYLQLALPGVALAATAAAAPWIPPAQWKNLATLLAIGVLAFVVPWRPLWPRHHNSDWRAAALAVNRVETGLAIPVVCPSPFIEARPPAWRPDYPLPGFLYAHLSAYPVAGSKLLFPFENTPASESWAATLVPGKLSASRQFLIYGWEPQVHFWRDWFARRPEFARWRQQRLGPFADVDVVRFEAP